MSIIEPIKPAPTEDFATSRRLAIDLIATLRARSVRVSLLGHITLHPGKTPEKNPIKGDALFVVLKEQTDVMLRVQHLLGGRDPQNQVPKPILEWLSEHARNDGDIVGAVRRLHKLSDDVVTHCKRCQAHELVEDEDLKRALLQQFNFGRYEFFEMVTNFCDALWQSIEKSRQQELEEAEKARATIAATLVRLERIGKHVKLVSLNAAVEASRAGDAGKGLSVIAVEFKSLAEEIQSLAVGAQSSLG